MNLMLGIVIGGIIVYLIPNSINKYKIMKSIFFVILFGVVSCTKPNLFKNNDLEKENLKGKVKSIIEYTINSNNKPSINRIYLFNQLGLLTFERNEASEDKDSYFYNYENGRVNSRKTITHRKNKQLETMSIYNYSKNYCVINTYRNDVLSIKTIKKYENNLLKSNYFYRYDIKGKNPYLNSHNKYYYNNKKQLINYETYLWKYGTKKEFLDWKETYIYDNKESEPVIKKVYTFDTYPNKYNHYVFEYSNKYDEKGNWIEKVCLDKKNQFITKRKITYYQ